MIDDGIVRDRETPGAIMACVSVNRACVTGFGPERPLIVCISRRSAIQRDGKASRRTNLCNRVTRMRRTERSKWSETNNLSALLGMASTRQLFAFLLFFPPDEFPKTSR